METKSFIAGNIKEALKLVKDEMGEDALVISTKKKKEDKGILGFSGREIIEVVAARARHNGNGTSEFNHYLNRAQENKSFKKEIYREEKILPDLNLLPILKILYQKMLSQGVEEKFSLNLARKVEKNLSPGEIANKGYARAYLASLLMDLVRRETPFAGLEKKGRKVIVLVGPTGSGKTTTIAKLAAIKALKEKKKVSLVSIKNGKTSLSGLLKPYAKLINVPIKTVSSKNEFFDALSQDKEKDFIFVDTPGLNQKDRERIEALASFFKGNAGMETHLVLSCSTKEDDLKEIRKGFQLIDINRILFSKLDESASFGNILNQLLRDSTPLSYFTTGQNIPEDIEPVSGERVADLILNLTA